ncbi:MAG: GTPase Era [Eubacteriales bacterium]|nr:GTPase Era [Eubacteriales bacterium]
MREQPESGEAGVSVKSGFVTILGKPNVGKSTLMNTLIGQKIAITSYKPQTTRDRIRTIYTDERGQIVFLDTPGLHRGKSKLDAYMLNAAQSTLKEVDLALWLVEPRAKLDEEDQAALELLQSCKTPVILVINKIDSVKKEQILSVIAAYKDAMDFAEIIPVSARTRAGVEDLRAAVFAHLPEGEPFYDEETVTDETQRDIAAEIIREKALRLLQEEVPHGIAVLIESMKWRGRKVDEICDIEATIICERDSHKGIIIGKGGAMLRKIGTAARIDIENMLECRVNLKIFVKVRRDWRDDLAQLGNFGYREKK